MSPVQIVKSLLHSQAKMHEFPGKANYLRYLFKLLFFKYLFDGHGETDFLIMQFLHFLAYVLNKRFITCSAHNKNFNFLGNVFRNFPSR